MAIVSQNFRLRLAAVQLGRGALGEVSVLATEIAVIDF